MGKGSGETTTQNFTPEMEQGIADAITLARKSVRPYMPYQGADFAAKTGGMIAGDQGLNLQRTALGLPNTTSSLPEAQNIDGVMAYSSYPMFQAEMERARANYPDLMQYIDDLQNDPFGLNNIQPASASIPNAASTGGVMNATAGGRDDDRDAFPNHGNTTDMFDGGMLFGSSNQNPTTINTSYSPVGDFVDWISGGYDYPEMSQADYDYYNSDEFGS